MSGLCSEIVEDIEDLIASQEITPKQRYSSKKSVSVRARRPAREAPPPPPTDSGVPGTQCIYVKTWGCAHNSSDSEYMAGQLAAYGYRLAEDKWEAQLWLLNSCTVKNPAEDHFRNEVELGVKSGRGVVVAGCVPQGMPRAGYLQGLSVVGVQQIDRIVEVVEETLKGNTVRLFGPKRTGTGRRAGGAPLALPKVRRNPLVEIIPINTGCLNSCTYCKTKHARGELASYPPEEIVERAKQAFSEGVREIWLTSEDTGTYGRDLGTTLPALLWRLVDMVPDGCRLRLGMTNPPYILEHLAEIARVMRHPAVYKFLHVPVQAGSDRVLGDMRREYTRADFEHVVDFLREHVPGITIATDIICGYPTETEDDFAETLDLCARHRFPSLFINQFYPRPGTPAARLPRVPPPAVKRRTRALTELFRSYEPYAGREAREYDVLVTDTSHDKRFLVAHNEFYEQVLLPLKPELLGQMVRARVTAVTKFSMQAEPLSITPISVPDPVPPPFKMSTVPNGVLGVSTGVPVAPKGVSKGTPMVLLLAMLAACLARLLWILLA